MADMGLFGAEPMGMFGAEPLPVMSMRTLPENIVTNPPIRRAPVIPTEHYGQFGPHPYGRPVASERSSSLPGRPHKIPGEGHGQFAGPKTPHHLHGKPTRRSSSLKDKRPTIKTGPRGAPMGLFGAASPKSPKSPKSPMGLFGASSPKSPKTPKSR